MACKGIGRWLCGVAFFVIIPQRRFQVNKKAPENRGLKSLSELLVEGTGYYVVLLLLCELYKVYGIAGNSYCELGVFLGVSLSVK